MTFNLFITTFAALFAICSPLGNAAIFLSITQGEKSADRKAQAVKGCFYMAAILLGFFLFGRWIMQFFGLSLPGIRIAGGLVIMRVGFDLLMPSINHNHSPREHQEAVEKSDISFSPLAMPLLAGPGSIASVIGISALLKNPGLWDYAQIILAILAVSALCLVILVNAERLMGFLGVTGANALTKIMAFILLCIGVQLNIDGILDLVKAS